MARSESAVSAPPPGVEASIWHRIWVGSSPTLAASAEHALLARHLKTPFTLSRVPIELPSLELGTQYISTLEINSDAPGPAIVWAHGAGAGIGWGYRTFDLLANLGGVRRRVVAFDWLGQANSSRPPFPSGKSLFRSMGQSEEQRIDAALRFFTLSLEEWRKAMRIEAMLLVAHSTGAYVAAHYAMAYPGVVRHLVLHGAAGLGPHPTPPASDGKRRAEGLETDGKRVPTPAVLSGLSGLWEAGWLNFGVVQRAGRLLREAIRGRFFQFIERRAGITDAAELDLFFDYFYSANCAGELSSDRWVNTFLLLLDNGEGGLSIYGRRPLADEPAERLARLPPIAVVYGADDWISATPSTAAAARALPDCTLHVEPKGNHHLYFDQPARFVEIVARELQAPRGKGAGWAWWGGGAAE